MEARLLVTTRTPTPRLVQVLEHGVAAALDHEVRRFDHHFVSGVAELLDDGIEHVPARLPLVREIGDEAEVAAFVGLVRLTVRLARGAQLPDQGDVALAFGNTNFAASAFGLGSGTGSVARREFQ